MTKTAVELAREARTLQEAAAVWCVYGPSGAPAQLYGRPAHYRSRFAAEWHVMGMRPLGTECTLADMLAAGWAIRPCDAVPLLAQLNDLRSLVSARVVSARDPLQAKAAAAHRA